MAYFTINGYDSYSGCDIVVTASLPLKTEEGEDIYFTLGSLQTLSVSTHQDKRPVRSLGNINAKDYVMGQRTIAGSLVFAVFDRHFADKIMRSAGVLMADEIPALNLTINFANEYGRSSRMAIYGVKLLNEGQVMSINDLYTENTYQFVALGMEPLTADDLEGSTVQSSTLPNKPTGGVITPIDPKLESIESKDFQDSSGKVVSDQIKNNSAAENKLNVQLFASVEQPIAGEETGIATISLKPIQQEGFIYITNLLTNAVEYTLIVNGSVSYNIELPIGFYNAKYMNTTRTIESNIEKITIRISTVPSSNNTRKPAYPVIDNVTYDTISVTMHNKDFSDIICYTSGDKDIVKENKGTVLFKGLKPDTEYTIYAKNLLTESNMVTVRTLPDNMAYYNKFKNYLYTNRGMLQNDYNLMIDELESLFINNKWPYENIIDGVSILKDSLIKQELLLYAMYFENSMIEAYNIDNPHKLPIVRNNVFDVDLSVDEWESAKYYSKQNNKVKLEGILNDSQSFNVRPSRAYSLYGIDKNESSIKQYVSTFSEEGKNFLSSYKDINKYQTLDNSYNYDMYPMLNTEELYALTIKDNFLCDKYILEEPYVYVNDNGKVYADVAYDDKVLLDDAYYFCISDIYSTLDNVPKRKEIFNRRIKEIDLSATYFPFDESKIYHCWIENYQGAIISKPFIFNYKQSIGLDTVLDKELLKQLKLKKNILSGSIDKLALDDIIFSLYSEGVPKKDLNTRFEFAILEYGLNSRYVSNAMEEYLYEVVISNVSNKLEVNRTSEIELFKSSNCFKVIPSTDLDTKVVTKSYYLDSQETICDIYGTNSMVNIKGDYMSIYLVNSHADKILGVAVLGCSKYNYKAIGFNVKVGDK